VWGFDIFFIFVRSGLYGVGADFFPTAAVAALCFSFQSLFGLSVVVPVKFTFSFSRFASPWT